MMLFRSALSFITLIHVILVLLLQAPESSQAAEVTDAPGRAPGTFIEIIASDTDTTSSTTGGSSSQATPVPTTEATPETTPETTEAEAEEENPEDDEDGEATLFPRGYGEPFNFSHVVLIGGNCGQMDWPSMFVAPGVETLPLTKHICSEDGQATTREFHLQGLAEVVDMVGDELNSTLVVCIGQGLETDWSPVAYLLGRGMAFFHGGFTGDLFNINLTDYNLKPDNVLYFYFRLDEESSARQAGAEVCRVKGGGQELKIGKIYREARPDLTFRVDSAVKGFQQACPDTELVTAWHLDFDAPEKSFESALLFKAVPEVVFSINDESIEKLLNVAERTLPADEYQRMSGSGWDSTHEHLMKRHQIITTVDQMVFHANRGLWGLMNTIISTIQRNGLHSTAAVQEELQLGDLVYITSDTLTISSDRVGYLLNQMLRGYNPASPPFRDVEVKSGLYDVTITEFLPFEGRFDAVIWLRTSWHDPRLSWNPFVYDGQLQIGPDKIWTPPLFFTNEFQRKTLHQNPVIVTSDGTCMQETSMQIQFLCNTDEDLKSFPFDDYSCSIDLASPSGIWLNAGFGFEIIESDPHFYTSSSVSNGTDIPERYNETDPDVITRHRYLQAPVFIDEYAQGTNAIFFRINYERKPFTAWVRLILPAVLINTVGFIAFWIPEVQESIALGVTSLLCSLAFRETVDMPDTADLTWTEVFMMVNIGYQASVMFIIWVSYGASSFAKSINNCCSWIYPKQAVKAVKQRVVAKVKENSVSALRRSYQYNGNNIVSFRNPKGEELIPDNDMVPDYYNGKNILPLIPEDDMVVPEEGRFQDEEIEIGGKRNNRDLENSSSCGDSFGNDEGEEMDSSAKWRASMDYMKKLEMESSAGKLNGIKQCQPPGGSSHEMVPFGSSHEMAPYGSSHEMTVPYGSSHEMAVPIGSSHEMAIPIGSSHNKSLPVGSSSQLTIDPEDKEILVEPVDIPPGVGKKWRQPSIFRPPPDESGSVSTLESAPPADPTPPVSTRPSVASTPPTVSASLRKRLVAFDHEPSSSHGSMPDDSFHIEELIEEKRSKKKKRRGSRGSFFSNLDDSFHNKLKEAFTFNLGLRGLAVGEKPPNVDWIGRWFVVPSYIIIMSTLIISGWGFFPDKK